MPAFCRGHESGSQQPSVRNIRKCKREAYRKYQIGFIKPQHASGQLSLLIGDKSCWGKDYAKESIRALTLYGFKKLGLQRIDAGCYDENLGALRAFLRVGYTIEGYFRKSVECDGRRIGCFWMGILPGECVE